MDDTTDDLPYAHLPINVIASDMAVHQEAEERDAGEAAAERREAEAAVNVFDLDDPKNQQFFEGDPPSAEDLGIDVAGLGPKRVMLVRAVAWGDQIEGNLKRTVDGRAAFLEAMGVPAITETRLQKLIEGDTTGWLSWIKTGAAAASKPDARSFERAQLEKRLLSDRHMAETALGALAEADAEIAHLTGALAAVRSRHQHFLKEALAELCEPLGKAYWEKTAELQDIVEQLFGAAEIVGSAAGFRSGYLKNEFSCELPAFGLSTIPGALPSKTVIAGRAALRGRPVISVSAEAARRAAAPWREIQAQLAADPRATIDVPPRATKVNQ